MLSTPDGAGGLGARLWGRAINSSAVFHYARVPMYWGTMARLRQALQLRHGERLLDVGCGTAMGAAVAHGVQTTYVGIDRERPHLQFARTRLRGAKWQFAVVSADQLAFPRATFDKALLLNVVHHLPDAVLDGFLAELRCAVRDRVVLCDYAPDRNNPVSALLLRHDRGMYVRGRDVLRQLLERHYRVEGEDVFMNRLRIVSQVIFTLVPHPER